jgi:lipoprotein signal peptidase
MGTGGRNHHRAAHYTLGYSRDHRVDIIQTSVKRIQAIFNLQDICFATGIFFIICGFILSSS